MENQPVICQSCGMPLDKDPNHGGTNSDQSRSDLFCSFCFNDGRFSDEGITLQEKIDRNVRMAVSRLNITEEKAQQMAERILPGLKRWK